MAQYSCFQAMSAVRSADAGAGDCRVAQFQLSGTALCQKAVHTVYAGFVWLHYLNSFRGKEFTKTYFLCHPIIKCFLLYSYLLIF